MNELKVIEKMGIVTSKDLEKIINKSLRSIQRQLKSLEIRDMIHVIIFKTEINRKPVYINDEIYKCLCQNA